MWIASSHGWFSVVKKDGGFHVRARSAEDLQALQRAVGGAFAALPIHHTPRADYHARVFVPADGAEAVLDSLFHALGRSVDYPNFKSRIASLPEQRDKLARYHDVWEAMHSWQTERERRGGQA
jgi:hypothetical protein